MNISHLILHSRKATSYLSGMKTRMVLNFTSNQFQSNSLVCPGLTLLLHGIPKQNFKAIRRGLATNSRVASLDWTCQLTQWALSSPRSQGITGSKPPRTHCFILPPVACGCPPDMNYDNCFPELTTV